MANEESHGDTVVTTSHTLDKKSSISTHERMRKCAPPPDSESVSCSGVPPVQCSKRNPTEDDEKRLGTVPSAGLSHKRDFVVDSNTRHMQNHGGSSSVQQERLVSRRGEPVEDGSSFLPVDALFEAPNGKFLERITKETAFREMPALSPEPNGDVRGSSERKKTTSSPQPFAKHSAVSEEAAVTAARREAPREARHTGKTPTLTTTTTTAPTTTVNLSPKTEGNDKVCAAAGVDGAAAQQKLLLEQSKEEQLQQKIDDQQEASQDEECRTDASNEAEKHLSPRFFLKPLPTVPAAATLSDQDVHLLLHARHSDPFGVLGPHEVAVPDPPYENKKVIVVRAWVRNAEKIRLLAMRGRSEAIFLTDEPVVMEKRAEMLFEKAFAVFHYVETSFVQQQQQQQPIPTEEEEKEEEKEEKKKTEEMKESDAMVDIQEPAFVFQYQLLCLYRDDPSLKEQAIYDTYNFGVLLPTFDLELFQSGSCWHVDNLLGSHCVRVRGVAGVRFAVWAPAARRVAVVGDWNGWDGRAHPMRKRLEFGVWELFIPALLPHEKYNYHITSSRGGGGGEENDPNVFLKIDPYAQEFEVPPKTASIISACDDAFKEPADRFQWTDEAWMKRRKTLAQKELRRHPMAIYEVHLPSWMRGDNNTYLSYRELADRLVQHVKNMNFTHVEFLPLAHHPFEGSWGYQVTGQYAPYSRLGTPDDFKYLVNTLHRSNIGVFLDFVPAHFCKDSWGLAQYDGEACYEYADPREGEHKLWGTLVFNFRRSEVRSFLLGAAYHWLRRYHIDGLRIDAVSSMLYKNHQRQGGEWIANEYGGDANLQAISLLQELNWVIHKQFPGVFTMAEESTSWQGVTDSENGLGFDAKWDLGWMNDTLSYLCLPLYKRPEPACHTKLTFRGLYMAHERWVLPLSHDEVVSGKGSLLDKCGFQGSPYEDRIKTLKTLFGFQVGSPGKPLIFMGAEIGQGREWSHERSVDWHEGQEELRKKLCLWLSDLLAVYAYHPALHAGDDEPWNFKWTDCDNHNDCVIAFLRSYQEWYNDMLVICNFSPNSYHRYPVGVPHGGAWQVILNSDDWRYAGGMVGPGNLTYVHTTQGGRLGWPYCLWLDLPPFGCLYLKCPQPSSPLEEKSDAAAQQSEPQKEDHKQEEEEKREVQGDLEEEKKKQQQHTNGEESRGARSAAAAAASAAAAQNWKCR